MTDEELIAQLAEARAEFAMARTDADELRMSLRRAEAALAAQIEADAKTCDRIAGNTKDFNAETRRSAGMCAAAIRNQPHDRTALDRVVAESLAAQQEGFIDVVAYAAKEASNRALLDAVDACRLYDAWGECRKAILALRGNYKPETSSQMDPPTKETDG